MMLTAANKQEILARLITQAEAELLAAEAQAQAAQAKLTSLVEQAEAIGPELEAVPGAPTV